MDTNGNGSLAGRRSSRSRSPQDRGCVYKRLHSVPLLLPVGSITCFCFFFSLFYSRDFEASNTGNTIHVSGLNYKVDGRDLENAFAKVGRVTKAYVVYDSHTHESRQFGFVMMETSEEADAAITALDGTELMGKVIAVAKVCVRESPSLRARPRTPTPGKYHGPSKRRECEPFSSSPYSLASLTSISIRRLRPQSSLFLSGNYLFERSPSNLRNLIASLVSTMIPNPQNARTRTILNDENIGKNNPRTQKKLRWFPSSVRSTSIRPEILPGPRSRL
ncbi:hypothetical protein K435DRAFT_652008 [Dendrothele bispora CBS 962.96]|uniref:RRM domain-containing protein n=1 Tax=Dendrothele bispora (strain CBS 962.96) TaxID=1314807 RepID=A0A4S8MKA1_DENBC|nr:hypothetical protein K435DRAFT_652008 [Dendrothele bispora CBS 962.96]